MTIYHSKIPFIAFFGDYATGIHAKSTDSIIEGVGVIHQLSLIEVLSQMIHDGIRHFNTDTDIHLIIFCL